MGRITDTVKHLILINFLFWGASLTIGESTSFDSWMNLHFYLNDGFWPWQVFTHMFMHSKILVIHIFGNMLALYIFGSPLEGIWGRNKFLFFYFSAGLGAVLLPFVIDYFHFKTLVDPIISNGVPRDQILNDLNSLPTKQFWPSWANALTEEGRISLQRVFFQEGLGASGCTMGLMVAFAMNFPNARLMLLFLPVPIKAKYFVTVILAYEIFAGVTGGTTIFGANVAHFAHLGGALTAFLIMWYWKKNEFNKNRWDN